MLQTGYTSTKTSLYKNSARKPNIRGDPLSDYETVNENNLHKVTLEKVSSGEEIITVLSVTFYGVLIDYS